MTRPPPLHRYVIGMLQMLELVDPGKIDMLRKQFESHDVDKSGRLDSTDLNALARQHELEALRRRVVVDGQRGHLKRPFAGLHIWRHRELKRALYEGGRFRQFFRHVRFERHRFPLRPADHIELDKVTGRIGEDRLIHFDHQGARAHGFRVSGLRSWGRP